MFPLDITGLFSGQRQLRLLELAGQGGEGRNIPVVDIVAVYGRSRGWQVRRRTILVEGTSDVQLIEFAAWFV